MVKCENSCSNNSVSGHPRNAKATAAVNLEYASSTRLSRRVIDAEPHSRPIVERTVSKNFRAI
jgi:hypothetical protein